MITRVLRFLLKTVAVVALTAAVVGLWLWFTTPDPTDLRASNPKMTRFMERHCQGGGDGCRISWTPIGQMAPFLPPAAVLAEDTRFYEHAGFDRTSLVAALKTNWESGKIVWGGSTITQQLAKNLYLGPEKTLGRKIKEMVLTYKIERSLDKKRILEIYLNVAQWGPALFGIDNAARLYFKKSPSDLTPLEASYLVSILPNPEHAAESAWKARFAEAGGHIFDSLLGGYLDYFVEPVPEAQCPTPMEASDRRPMDFAIAKTFNQFWKSFLAQDRTEPTLDTFLKSLSPEEWAVVQGLLQTEDKASGFDAFLALVAIRQRGYCLK